MKEQRVGIVLLVGLPRLQNFVNVYTNFTNQNDSVHTQFIIIIIIIGFGSAVVECFTRDRGAAGSGLTRVALLCH